jgi:hypothetical protein
MSPPKAKSAAAARMQAPIVANNLLEDMGRPAELLITMVMAPARSPSSVAKSYWRSSATAVNCCPAFRNELLMDKSRLAWPG